MGFLKKKEARKKVVDLSERYGLKIDPDAHDRGHLGRHAAARRNIKDALSRNNDILIFDEPTAVLTPQEIDELMSIMRSFANEGKSILFITHKLNEIMAVADRCTVLRKGKCVGTVDVVDTDKVKLSRMMVGRDVDFIVEKGDATPGETVLEVERLTVPSKAHKNNAVKNVSLQRPRGRNRLPCGNRRQRTDRIRLRAHRVGKTLRRNHVTLKGEPILRVGRASAASSPRPRLSNVKPVHMSDSKAQYTWHEPYSRGSPEVRPGTGLQP